MKCIQKLGMALMLCLGVVTATDTAFAEPLYDKARGTSLAGNHQATGAGQSHQR